MMKALLLIAAFAVPSPALTDDVTVSPEEAAAWIADLEFVRTALPENHANLFHSLTPDEFHALIDALCERVPSMAEHEIVVELAAIVAAIEDGHTRLTLPMVEGSGIFSGHSPTPPPNDPGLAFHHYPIRLHAYSDGLFVRSIGRENAQHAGAKVVRVGRMSAEDAMQAVTRVIQRDNEMQLQLLRPSRLVIPEILHALGIISDMEAAEFVLEDRTGVQHEVALSPVPGGSEVEWVDAREPSGDAPLYLRDIETNYWFEFIEAERTVYCQYNEVYDEGDEDISAFAVRLMDFVQSRGAERLVIDLRHNVGGDNSLNRSFLHALIRCPEVQEPGSLFVITGRGTFSAAMMFCIDLEKHTNAIFVGEPTGASLNHYGDSRKIQLPNSGLTIRVSSLYWQYSGPKDHRPWIAPHIPAPLSSQDYRLGLDPALEAILGKPEGEPGPDGVWTGRFMEYDIVVRLRPTGDSWQATIDFPDEGALGLPLENVCYDFPVLRFDFPNGDSMIRFEGTSEGDRMIGGATMSGRVSPWVLFRKR